MQIEVIDYYVNPELRSRTPPKKIIVTENLSPTVTPSDPVMPFGSLLDEIRNTIRGFNDSVNPGSEVEDDTEETEFGTTIRQSVGIAASDFPMDLPDYVSSEDRNRILEIERLDDDYLQSVASADKVRFDWHKDPEIFTGVKEDFTASAGPTFPVDETMSPLDIMEKIWDPAIIDLIVEQTNTYARRFQETGIKDQSRMKAWKPIKTEDIWNFFAILILQSLDPRPTETEYWYSSIPYLAMPSFGQAMRAKKYIRIKKCLHFVDNQNMPKGDKLAKIRPIVDYLNDKFATLYIPSQNIALDESLMLWKGRLGFVQKISNKAAGVGIKTYELAETETGYLWTFRVYAGKGDNVEQIEQNEQDKRSDEPDGKVSAIVLDFVKPLLHKGYTLVMDNFYNSPLLSRLLKMQKTDTLGTLHINREFVPESLKHCAKRDMRVGELVYSHTNDLSVILWRDSNMVAMISSYHKVEVGGKEKYGKYKYKPQAVLDYNKSMGGLQDVVDSGLEGNEYVTLLSWVLNTYPGIELMGSSELNIDWMEKTLEAERAEWGGARAPDVEPHSRAYHTHAPVIVFQMIDQNLQVTETISKEITFKALMLSIEQKLRDEAARFLLEEAFLDLEVHFDDLFTSKWVASSIPVDTICVTLEDYFQDYNHLREKNFEYVINEAQNLVYKKYITAMLSKKVTFKTPEEAQQAATKIVKEANQIRAFFRRIGAEGVDVLRCQDIEMLSLDLHGVLEKCPDISEEHLIRLLWLRGDVPRAHVRDTVAHVTRTRRPARASQHPDFFKHVTFNDRLLGHFAL
ncbi:hypothetical protein MSG28_006194 [Choristoneura fumiferana]|uniref:Uncharacterized protein n=2 Tax=Choristoneura fumiferana TaxID=7141 RepID=A0ACC0JE07_CHOFU|nr:hypothetical protein MSG28_006194 [Choristoneura fumiferana]